MRRSDVVEDALTKCPHCRGCGFWCTRCRLDGYRCGCLEWVPQECCFEKMLRLAGGTI